MPARAKNKASAAAAAAARLEGADIVFQFSAKTVLARPTQQARENRQGQYLAKARQAIAWNLAKASSHTELAKARSPRKRNHTKWRILET